MDNSISEIDVNWNNIKNDINSYIEKYKNRINNNMNEINTHVANIEAINSDLLVKNIKYREDYNTIKDEMDNHRKVSIVSNLSKQITERDRKIKLLEKKITELNKSIISIKSADASKPADASETVEASKPAEPPKPADASETVEASEPADASKPADASETVEAAILIESSADITENMSESDEDIEYELKQFNRKYYYISNESPQKVYKLTNNNELGDYIGNLINNKIVK
jgi:hypothetical protein